MVHCTVYCCRDKGEEYEAKHVAVSGGTEFTSCLGYCVVWCVLQLTSQ